MKRRGQTTVGLAIALVAALCVFAPFLFAPNSTKSVLTTAYVMAAGGWQHTLSDPIVVSRNPLITVRAGRISVANEIKDAAPSGVELLKRLADGSVPLLLDDALIEIELSRSTSPIVLREDAKVVDGETQQPTIAPVVFALQSVDFSDLRLSNATVVAIGGDGHSTRFHNVEGRILRQNGRFRATGQLGFRNDTLKVDIDASKPTPADGDVRAPFKAAISNAMVSTSVTGVATFGDQVHVVSENLDLRIPEVASFAKWLGAAWPSRHGVRSFAVSGQMDWANGKLSFPKSKFIIDANVANGSISLSQRQGVTFVDGTLAFEKLDAAPYFQGPQVEPDPKSGSAWLDALAGSTGGLSLMGELNNVHADLRISAAAFKAHDFQATDIAATINLSGGHLIADIANMQMASGGQGSIQVSIDNKGPKAKCRLLAKLDGMDLALASRLLFGAPVIVGAGQVTANLTGYGLDRADLLATMTGKLDVSSDSTLGLNVDVAKLITEYKAAEKGETPNSADNSQNWISSWSGITEISQLKAKLRTERGRMKAESIRAKAGNHAIAARGTADLLDEKIELELYIGKPAENDPPNPNGVAGTQPGERPMVPPDAIWGVPREPIGVTSGDMVRFRGDWNQPTVAVKPIEVSVQDSNDVDSTSELLGPQGQTAVPATIQ